MEFMIFVVSDGGYKKIANITKDTKSIEGIINTIKTNGYVIGGIKHEYHLEFDDIVTLGMNKTSKKGLVIKPV